jgi:hypothetical protein
MSECAEIIHFKKIESHHAYAETDEVAELWLRNHKEVKSHIFARIAGVSFANLDGSSRQDSLATCKPLDPLILKWEVENPVSRTAISVNLENGHQLGYLEAELGKTIFKCIQKGEHWSGFIVHIGSPDKYLGAVIVLTKLSPLPVLAVPLS